MTFKVRQWDRDFAADEEVARFFAHLAFDEQSHTQDVQFLRRLLRHNRGRKLFLILDSHPVHLAQAVRRWFKRHRAALRVYFLPGYSPELNPDEYLNQDVKANAVGRTRPFDRAELVGNVRAYVRSTQAHPSLVKRYFQADSVRYASV